MLVRLSDFNPCTSSGFTNRRASQHWRVLSLCVRKLTVNLSARQKVVVLVFDVLLNIQNPLSVFPEPILLLPLLPLCIAPRIPST